MKESTTGLTNNIRQTLDPFNDTSTLLFLIAIHPQNNKESLLEEQGKWLLNFWNEILSLNKEINGCRILWNSLFFPIKQPTDFSIEEKVKQILFKLQDPRLKSICVTMETSGNTDTKIDALDIMQLETSSPLNFNTITEIKTRYINGTIIT